MDANSSASTIASKVPSVGPDAVRPTPRTVPMLSPARSASLLSLSPRSWEAPGRSRSRAFCRALRRTPDALPRQAQVNQLAPQKETDP